MVTILATDAVACGGGATDEFTVCVGSWRFVGDIDVASQRDGDRGFPLS